MPMAIAFPNKWTVIPSVIQSPLNISKSSSMYNGKPAIMFRGNSNGQMTVVAVVSDKRLDLFVQMRKRIKAEPSHKKQQPLCICQAQWLLPYEIQAVFIFTRSLSAISAINSLLVGLPFPLCIV